MCISLIKVVGRPVWWGFVWTSVSQKLLSILFGIKIHNILGKTFKHRISKMKTLLIPIVIFLVIETTLANTRGPAIGSDCGKGSEASQKEKVEKSKLTNKRSREHIREAALSKSN
jgi:branched-subunit amino acid permease